MSLIFVDASLNQSSQIFLHTWILFSYIFHFYQNTKAKFLISSNKSWSTLLQCLFYTRNNGLLSVFVALSMILSICFFAEGRLDISSIFGS